MPVSASATSEAATMSGPGRVLRNLMSSDRTMSRNRMTGRSGAAAFAGGRLAGGHAGVHRARQPGRHEREPSHLGRWTSAS
jgi:hypothetical protein